MASGYLILLSHSHVLDDVSVHAGQWTYMYLLLGLYMLEILVSDDVSLAPGYFCI